MLILFLTFVLTGCLAAGPAQITETSPPQNPQDQQEPALPENVDIAKEEAVQTSASTESTDADAPIDPIVDTAIEEELDAILYEGINENGFKEIFVDEAYKIFLSGKDFLFVDVRTQEEYDFGHVKGAIHVPAAEIEVLAKQIAKDRIVIVYCIGTGCYKSTYSAGRLADQGFAYVYKMGGLGIIEWMQKEYPTEKNIQ
jgi:rhodanese-related sulfurtransferase